MKDRGKWRAKALFIFISGIYSNLLLAQYENLKFENYSTAEGLSSSTCVEIFQDSEGFMWFGTIDGLNKYDGYRFSIYRPILGDSSSISGNRITSIEEDCYNNLWIGSSTGLDIFNSKTERFKSYDVSRFIDSDITDLVINDILYEDSAIWVGSNIGLLYIDIALGQHSNSIDYARCPLTKLLDAKNVINVIPTDSAGVIAGTNNTDLYFINKRLDRPVRKQIIQARSFGLNHLPYTFMKHSSGEIYIGNDLSSLVTWNPRSDETSTYDFAEGKHVPIFDLYEDHNGFTWVATDGFGIYLLNDHKELVQHITNDPEVPSSLPNNQPSSVLQDRDSIFWIATYNKGLSKLVLQKSVFAHYFKKEEGASKIAQSVIEDQKGNIWVGTDGGGLSLLDEESGFIKEYRHEANNPWSISSNKIVYLHESSDGKIWICTWDGGLSLFDPETSKAKTFRHDPTNPHSLGQNTVWFATEDVKGRLWCGTQSSGLNVYDPKDDKFYRYMSGSGAEGLKSNLVFSLLIDSKNRLLIGTGTGLQVVDLDELVDLSATNQLPWVKTEVEGLIDFRINHMAESPDGSFWIGTDIGLHHLSAELELLNAFTTKDGLPNNLVVGVAIPDSESVWITTKSGLSRLNVSNNQFKNFNVHDGIQGMEFQSKSIDLTKDGRILAGGINGLNIFHPKNVKLKNPAVKPKITQLKVMNSAINAGDILNERVLIEKPIDEVQNITLYYDEGFVTFDFVALFLSNPERVNYAHRMVGVNDDWVYIRENRNASYSNLVAGDYTFEVMASLDDDWANANTTRLNIKVLPPPWKTWWANLIIIGTVGFITWLSFRFYMNRINEQRVHELDQMKLKFFINVSHEFRTPLTLILNPVDKIISQFHDQDVVKNSAYTIQRSAKKLLNLVNQLLDLRKLDMGEDPLDPVKGDMVNFLRDIYQFYLDLAQTKSIKMTYSSQVESLFMWFDPDKLEKILGNLLSNAIKFTGPDGQVSLDLAIFSKKQLKGIRSANEDHILISVKDTGIGLTQEQKSKVFQRFFHVDNSQTGTGIGLNYTKTLVEIHGGEITVDSEYGSGSEFRIILPVHSNAIDKAIKSNKMVRNTIKEFDKTIVRSLEYDLAISEFECQQENITPEGVNQTVLVVEDNNELRKHLKNELSPFYKVKEAVNGSDGLAKARKFFPDIIISDVMMPEMDGFEMCSKLKTDPETSHVPVILLTARSMEEDRLEGYSIGADAYLPKPFNITILKVRIKNLLDAKQKMREKFMDMTTILPSSEITTNSFDEQFLDKATSAILENLDDSDFGLEQILELMGVSRSHFYRKIQSITGQNPSNFIRTVRLKYAAELLKQNNLSIKEISYKVGFNSTAYFSKTFRELFGTSPNQFHQDHMKK